MQERRLVTIVLCVSLVLTIFIVYDTKTQIIAMQNKLDAIYSELEDHKNEFHGINYDTELSNIYSKIDRLYGEISTLYGKIDDLYERQQSETSAPSTDNVIIEELRNKTKELEAKIQALEEAIKDFELKTKELESQIKNFEGQTDDYKDKAHVLELKAQEFENKIKALENQIREFEGKIKDFETKIEELETEVEETMASVTTQEPETTSPITNGIYEDFEHMYYGRLFIPGADINVALYYGYTTDITDREDSANIFFFGDGPGFTIADHNYQEFSKLFNVKIDTYGYIQHKYDGIVNIKCVDVFNGYNTGRYIVDENGVNAMDRTAYMMYTCRNNTRNVLICLWEIVPSGEMAGSNATDVAAYVEQRRENALAEIDYCYAVLNTDDNWRSRKLRGNDDEN